MHENIKTAGLVDITTVSVDKDLPQQERCAEYLRQIKNPYQFKCGEIIITARYPESGPTIEECLQGIMT